jgi:hypothetical protein
MSDVKPKKLFYYCDVLLSTYVATAQSQTAVDSWVNTHFPGAIQAKHALHATALYVGRSASLNAIHAADLPAKYAAEDLRGVTRAVEWFYQEESRKTVVVLSFNCAAFRDLHVKLFQDAQALSATPIPKPDHFKTDGTLHEHGFNPHVTLAVYDDSVKFKTDLAAAMAADALRDLEGIEVRLLPLREFYE